MNAAMPAERTGGRPRLLMPVFNEIQFDGRVRRAAEALADDFDVCVLAIESSVPFEPNGFRVATVRLPRRGVMKSLRHAVFWLRMWSMALRGSYSVVYAHDFFLSFAGWLAARIGRARLVYDAHELIVRKRHQRWNVRDLIFQTMERWVVPRADLVVAAGPERARLMKHVYGLPSTPVVVRNIVPPVVAATVDTAGAAGYGDLSRPHPGVVRVVYQGDVNLRRGLATFVDAMRHLDERFELLIIGGGPDLEAIRAHVSRLGLDARVRCLGRIPSEHIVPVLATCDIGIVTYPVEGLNNKYCAPNKVFEYAQAGLPVVTTDQPPLRSLHRRYGTGLPVSIQGRSTGDEALDIAEALKQIADDPDRFRAGIDRMLHDHTWSTEATKLRRAVRGLGMERVSGSNTVQDGAPVHRVG